MHATYMRIENSEHNVASRIDEGLTQGAGLYMSDEYLREAGKGAKLRRRMSGKE